MGKTGAILGGVRACKVKCKQCGDVFEHFTRLCIQRTLCDYCKRKRQLAYQKERRGGESAMACSSKKSAKKPAMKAKKGK